MSAIIMPRGLYPALGEQEQHRVEVVQVNGPPPSRFPRWRETWTVFRIKAADWTPLGNVGWELIDGRKCWFWFAGNDLGHGSAASAQEAVLQVLTKQGAI